MRPHTALKLNRIFTHPALGIGDSQIVECNDAAAELYGFAHATDLAGRFESDLKVDISTHASRASWAARQEGYITTPDYCTLIRRPDGEVVGHQGTLVSQMAGIHGESYLTQLERVMELDEPPVPNLETLGITPDQAVIHTGHFTVAEVRAMSRELLTLHFGAAFPIIIEECERVSTVYFDWPSGYGLDFALRADLCTWSLSDKATTVVYYRRTCPSCARSWDARKAYATQCPSCRTHLERGARDC